MSTPRRRWRARVRSVRERAGGVREGNFWQQQTEVVVRCLLQAAAVDGRSVRDLYRWSFSPDEAKEAVKILGGYDVSVHTLERVESRRAARGANNVTFHDVESDLLPREPTFDLVTTFDCLHDMTRPLDTVRAIRNAIVDDGVWFIVDIDCAPTFEQNLRRRRFATMLYSNSVYACLSSAMSEPGGAGLGICGLSEPVLRELVGEGGFSRFHRLDIEHLVNAFYDVRP